MISCKYPLSHGVSRWIFFLIILSLLTACRPTAPVIIQPDRLDSTPRLVILSAFDAELAALRRAATLTGTVVINGRSYHLGALPGHPLVLVLPATSMLNAAMTTQAVIDHFNVSAILFSGIAGGVNPDLHIGDVVIPAQWAEYQEALFARAEGDGWDTGSFSTEFGNYGMIFPQRVEVTRKDGKVDATEQVFWFAVSPQMLDAARQAATRSELKRCTLGLLCLDDAPQVIVGGNGVSGSTFVDNAAYREWVWQTFQADALDMETAAVAHVAYTNAVPFIAFRSLSDLAGGGTGKNELLTFYNLAAENASRMVEAFLKEWKQ